MTIYILGFFFTLFAVANYYDRRKNAGHSKDLEWLWILALAGAWPVTLGIIASDLYYEMTEGEE